MKQRLNALLMTTLARHRSAAASLTALLLHFPALEPLLKRLSGLSLAPIRRKKGA